jgi:hypothetical protein
MFETISKSSPRGSQWESICVVDPPPDGGTFKQQRLFFLYDLFVPEDSDDSSLMETVDLMEGRIHNGLVQQYLLCPIDNETSVEMYIWEVTSMPVDVILSINECVPDASLSTPPNSTCVVIAADLGMTALYPPEARREYDRQLADTEADQEFLEVSGTYLDEAMTNGDFDGGDVLQVIFRGFVMPEEVNDRVTGGVKPPTVAGANTELQNEQNDSKAVAGSMAIAFAIICLIVVAVLGLYRRKLIHEIYLHHLDEIESVTDYDFEKDYGINDRRTEIVGNLSFDWMPTHEKRPGNEGTNSAEDLMKLVPGGLNYQHDVRKCTSAYCLICQSHDATKPIFVRSGLGPEATFKDLRHRPSIAESESRRSYSTPDTTEL